MKSDDVLLAAWEANLGKKDAPAIFDTSGRVLRTFAGIEEGARRFEGDLFGKLEAGSVVAVQIGNHADWPSLLIACLRKQLVFLPLEQSMSERERTAAFETGGAAAVVETALPAAPGSDKPPGTAASTENIQIRHLAHQLIDWGDYPPSLLKLTSGTTSLPRAIRFRSPQLLADGRQICETMGINDGDLQFAVIPFSHSYGFSNLITPLLTRGVRLVLSHDKIPRAILNDLDLTRATVFPGMPVFFQAFCEMDPVPELRQLRLCISAGAPLSLEVARKFREKYNRSIHSFYGSSECGGICYDRAASVLEPGFVGAPLHGVELEPLNPDAPATQVLVRSAAVGDGYFPEPDADRLGDGTFKPDDLLSRSGEGWRVVGRVSDVINVAGKKVHPAEVEEVLLRYEGVRGAVVFGRESVSRNEEIVACVAAGPSLRETELLKFCRTRLSGWQVPKRIFLVEEIPVNERGKVSRRELVRRFRS